MKGARLGVSFLNTSFHPIKVPAYVVGSQLSLRTQDPVTKLNPVKWRLDAHTLTAPLPSTYNK